MIKLKQFAFAILALSIIASCKQAGFQKFKPGIEYQIFSKGKGSLIKDSDIVMMHVIQKMGDSTIMSTYEQGGQPMMNQLKVTDNALDATGIYFKMKVGDSVVVRYNQDSIFKGQQKPAFIKPTDQLLMIVKFTERIEGPKKDSILNVQQMQARMQDSMKQAMMQKQMESSKKLVPVEAAKIATYLTSKNLTAQKSANGVYYAITQPGSGALPMKGQKVTMKYTGSLLDGTVFDSNVDPKFNHVEPFSFTLGKGEVIPGWDEGVALLNKGSKATLVIPSYLAYGENPPPGSPMKPNSILRFDVEVIDFK